ncbi:MAG: hypothetical protein AAF560_11960 [Acidobacteriota bacterium]
MRNTTLDALAQDLELLFSTFEPSLTTVRLAFAGIGAMALIWFL